MKKIAIVIGTRPEAIKLAPVVYELRQRKNFDVKVFLTSQHKELLSSNNILQIYNIIPDYDLNILKHGQSINDVIGRIFIDLPVELNKFMPDVVLVQGDTATCMASAVVAYNMKIKIGHVEAGLRTYNLDNPFPEEAYRQIVSRISDIHFAPTDRAKTNLLQEKINGKIYVTGNTVVDALNYTLNNFVIKSVKDEIDTLPEKIFRNNSKYILITSHRRENYGEPLRHICDAVKELSLKFPEYNFIFPVHLNPEIQNNVRKELSDIENIYLTRPLSYPLFIKILSKAYFVLTDSGGIQEEAASLGIPLFIMRNYTERMEATETGNAFLTGTSSTQIVNSVLAYLNTATSHENAKIMSGVFGDGNAAKRIADILQNI